MIKNKMSEEIKETKMNEHEPEDLIMEALYLLQLCQQDLNMGRKETILARARRARECCHELEDMMLGY
jgi:hypothetical protein